MVRPLIRAIAAVCALLLLAACVGGSPSSVTSRLGIASPSPTTANQTPAESNIGPAPSASVRPRPGQCGSPTDHVYRPYRLRLINACLTVSGTIATIRSEADGDYHVLLALDPQYRSLLQPANLTDQGGNLVLEPVCQHEVTQADAVGPCLGSTAQIPIPPPGTHVLATGAYVYDLDHGAWAELHPLFEIHPG